MNIVRNTMAIAALAVTFGVSSCRKDAVSQLSDEESRIYITNRDSAVNFQSYKTYSISDSVLVVDGSNAGKQQNNTDIAFVTAFKAEMQARGYSLVNKDAAPDLGIQISRIIRTSTGLVSYPDYWGYWDSYYWGFPGYGYGNPYWGVATYQIREGMLSFDMVDLKHAASSNQLKVVWNGMIRGSGIFNANTAASQVQQLFGQSTYLTTN